MPALFRNHLVLGFLLAAAMPAQAEDRSASFVALMSRLPDAATATGSPAIPEFVDLAATRQAVDRLVSAGGGAETGTMRLYSGPFADAPFGEDWTPRVGFSREEVLAAARNGMPEDSGLVLLLDPAAVPRVGPALLANGYALTEHQGLAAYVRGEKDNSMDLANRAADDPFAYSIPKSSRIALEGEILLQAATWPMLAEMSKPDAGDTAITAFAAAIDLPDWGEHALLQASILSNPEALAAGAGDAGAMPAWTNLMLADLSDGKSDLTLLALAFPDKGDAETAAQLMGETLGGHVPGQKGDRTLADLTGPGRALVAGTGPFAAIYAIETAPDLMQSRLVQNRGYQVLFGAILRRELGLLVPATP